MATIIAVVNQKGGIGKTTTAFNLAAALASKKKDVLLIDLDGQGNLSFYALPDYPGASRQEKSIVDVVEDGADFSDVIERVAGLDIIPASLRLIELENKIASFNFGAVSHYDYVFLDCPPNVGGVTVAAMKASDAILIPTTTDAFSYTSVEACIESALTLEKKVQGIVIIRTNERNVINRDLKNDFVSLADSKGVKLYKSTIRDSVAIRESQVARQNIFSYAPHSAVAEDFEKLAAEFLKGE